MIFLQAAIEGAKHFAATPFWQQMKTRNHSDGQSPDIAEISPHFLFQ